MWNLERQLRYKVEGCFTNRVLVEDYEDVEHTNRQIHYFSVNNFVLLS